MCGRVVVSLEAEEIAAELDCLIAPPRSLDPGWNLPPTSELYIVADARSGPGGRQRRLEIARWGLVPRWAGDSRQAAATFNARIETVEERPTYREAFGARRCLVPVDGYYEWSSGPEGKQPYFIHDARAPYLCLAGIYEFWRDPSAPREDPKRWLLSTSILTTAAEGGLADLHPRMPVVLDAGEFDEWLNPRSGAAAARAVVGYRRRTAERLAWHRVDPAVGSVSEDRPGLIEEWSPAAPRQRGFEWAGAERGPLSEGRAESN